MTMVCSLLRCAALVLAVVSCQAFAPSAASTRAQVTLSASNNDDITIINNRRTFLSKTLATTAAAATLAQTPLAAFAEEDEKPAAPKKEPLEVYIYNILRVREATEQETRLINSGKFKDVQRANVKLAVKFMINNYKLSDSVIAASSYLKGNARVQASGTGQSAVQSLFTIVEYFDSSDVENIKIDSLAGKEAIVNSGLKSVRRDLDEFMTYFPADVVEQAKKKIMEENELNFREFDPSLGAILNPNPTK